jgi:hypothetical protein
MIKIRVLLSIIIRFEIYSAKFGFIYIDPSLYNIYFFDKYFIFLIEQRL